MTSPEYDTVHEVHEALLALMYLVSGSDLENVEPDQLYHLIRCIAVRLEPLMGPETVIRISSCNQ